MKKIIALNILLALIMVSCSLKKRDPKTPVETNEKVDTGFFFKCNKERTKCSSKRFLYGMSTEDKAGVLSNYSLIDHYNVSNHSNIEFDFNENGTQLIGRLVNPTYPNNKDKWSIVLSFNVNTYYEEKQKDSKGREGRDIVRRSDKSDPRARPYLNLKLSSFTQYINSQSPTESVVGLEVEDIEWGKEGKFLGFSVVAITPELGSDAQAIKRVNLLSFEPNEKDFIETPFHEKNTKHVQILDIVGSRPNYFGQKLKAIHWDINGKTKKKHKIYLHNFPEEYLQVGIDAIESWNKVFKKMDGIGYAPFEHEISKRKFAFDLRYHTIHWVDDVRLSAAGPLGLANIAADITNGKVLWTSSIIWGGLIDLYASRDVPSIDLSEGSSPYAMNNSLNLNHLLSKQSSVWKPNFDYMTMDGFDEDLISTMKLSLDSINNHPSRNDIKKEQQRLDQLVVSGKLNGSYAEKLMKDFKYKKEAQDRIDGLFVLTDKGVEKLYSDMKKNTHPGESFNLDAASEYGYSSPFTLESMLTELGLSTSMDVEGLNLFVDHGFKKSEFFKTLPESFQKSTLKQKEQFRNKSFDSDRYAIDVLRDVTGAVRSINKDGSVIDVFDVKRGIVLSTLIHEIGHTLGLGHNFKSNILPKKGDVPKDVYNDLLKDAQNGMINQSSIMGYAHGYTIALTPYDKHKPGVNDINRLHYLYNQKYVMYDKSSKGESPYEFVSLKGDGLIQEQVKKDGKILTPGYLPNCNDLEATFYLDPFCNRHDRGYNAQTLVENYFDRISAFLNRYISSDIDSLSTRDYMTLEARLWSISSRMLTRSRFFHDFMRREYSDEILSLKAGAGESKVVKKTFLNLMSFASSCKKLKGLSSNDLENHKSHKVSGMFIDVDADGSNIINQFGDLCIATNTYFEKAQNLLRLQGEEYSEIDYKDAIVPGGRVTGDPDVDYSQAYGSWKSLSLMPIKYNIMKNLTLPFMTFVLGPWELPLYPYDRKDTSFHMSTLFAKEYLETLNTMVKSSIKIENGKKEPRISRSLLYLGYFLRFQNQTEDYELFNGDILNAIASQTQFRFSNAYIYIESNKEPEEDLAYDFKGYLYNRFNTADKVHLGSIYLFGRGKFIMSTQVNSLVYPFTSIYWSTPSLGSALGVKLDFEPNHDFGIELEKSSPRNFFITEFKSSYLKCSEGLKGYFKKSEDSAFEGIYIPSDISDNPNAYKQVHKSVEDAYATFVEKNPNFDLNHCERTIVTQKALILGAALLSGFRFQETYQMVESGGQ